MIDGVLRGVVFNAHLREAANDCFTQVVTPEANSDCTSVMLARIASTTGNRLTHRSNTNKRRRNTSIQSLDNCQLSLLKYLYSQLTYPNKTLPCNRLPNNIHRTRVYTPLGCLQPHLHQVERVTDNDRTNTTGTTCSEGPDLSDGLVDRLGLSDLHIFLDFVCRGSRGGSHCDGDQKWGGGVGELYSKEGEEEKRRKEIEVGEIKIKGE